MLKSLLRLSSLAIAAFILSAPHLFVAPAEAQGRVPDYGNMELINELPVTGVIDALGFTPDNSIIVASEKDHFLSWNTNTGQPVKTIQGADQVRSNFILFTEDGKTMITAGSDAEIRLWNFEKGEVTQTLSGHRGFLTALILSPSGKLMASGSSDRTIRIWDVKTGEQVHELSGIVYPAAILAFSEDEKTLTTFGGTGSLETKLVTERCVWNAQSGEQIKKDVIDDFGPPYAVTADGKTLIGVSIVRTPISSTKFKTASGLRLFDVNEGGFKAGISVDPNYYMSYQIGPANNIGLHFSPNKAVLAITRPKDTSLEAVFLWGGGPVTDLLPRLPVRANVLMFSPDSRMIATWTDNLKVKIFYAP